MNIPRILFFDAADTLFFLPRGVSAHYQEVALRHGSIIEKAILREAFIATWQQRAARPTVRRARPDDDREWWRELVYDVLDRCGISERNLPRERYFAEVYAEFTKPGVWQLFPEIHQVLAALRPHYRLGLISNFDGRLRPILADLGLAGWFDPLVISSEVGADKPAPWIFERALELAGVPAGEAMHIGDDPTCDWAGATAAGLRVFRLDRPHNSLQDLIALLPKRPEVTTPCAF